MSSSIQYKHEELVSRYEKFLNDRESDYRISVERQLYDSISAKSSVKWLLTGFLEDQIYFESGGDQNAVSLKGALGVAQFMPSTWKALKDKKLIPKWFAINNEAHQRLAQLIYMDHLYNMWYGSLDRKALTIASYNAGPGVVQNIVNLYGNEWKNHLPDETIDYLHKLKLHI